MCEFLLLSTETKLIIIFVAHSLSPSKSNELGGIDVKVGFKEAGVEYYVKLVRVRTHKIINE